MQSSASLSRRSKAVSSGGVEEMEAEEASIMSKQVAAESQPLLAVLQIIGSDKYSSIFDRRFESQVGFFQSPQLLFLPRFWGNVPFLGEKRRLVVDRARSQGSGKNSNSCRTQIIVTSLRAFWTVDCERIGFYTGKARRLGIGRWRMPRPR